MIKWYSTVENIKTKRHPIVIPFYGKVYISIVMVSFLFYNSLHFGQGISSYLHFEHWCCRWIPLMFVVE